MPHKTVVSPSFRDLNDEEIETLLSRNHVGRIAFSFHDAVDIRPIHYVHHDGWLYGRTSESDKLLTLRHNQWVAFEIDEVKEMFDWKSVVVHGTFYHLAAEGTEYDIRLYERAVRSIRELTPETLTERDPVPFRTEIFAIHVETRTGRSSSTKSEPRPG